MAGSFRLPTSTTINLGTILASFGKNLKYKAGFSIQPFVLLGTSEIYVLIYVILLPIRFPPACR